MPATTKNGRAALGYMLIAVFGYSLTPLVIAFASANNPFLLNAGWRTGLVLGLSTVIIWHWKIFRSQAVRSLIRRRLKSLAIVAAAISNFDYAWFALSTGFIDISAATVIFETWPLWMVLTLAGIYRKEDRYRRITKSTMLLIGMCIGGLALVTISQTQGTAAIFSGTAPEQLLLGSALALAGALAGSLAAHSFRWGTDLAKEIAIILQSENPAAGHPNLDLLCLVLAYSISSSIAAAASFCIGIASAEPMQFKLEMLAITGGLLTYAPATIAWRMGNLRSANLGVNAIIYGTPVLSLIWFYLLSKGAIAGIRLDALNIQRADYLLAGAAAIIAANVLINFESEIRRKYQDTIQRLFGSRTTK